MPGLDRIEFADRQTTEVSAELERRVEMKAVICVVFALALSGCALTMAGVGMTLTTIGTVLQQASDDIK